MKASLLFPLFLILTIVACKKPTEALNNSTSTWKEYKNPAISRAHLKDTLPSKFSSLALKEIQGVRVCFPSGHCTHYFEYETDTKKLLTLVSSLPFKRSNTISDSTCRIIYVPFSLSGKTILSKEELVASNFFWQINPDDFMNV